MARGQDTLPLRNRLTFELGYARLANFDNVGSPLPYAAAALPIGGTYEYIGEHDRHTLEGSAIVSLINAPTMSNRYSSATDLRKAYFVFLDMQYRYVRDLMPLFSTSIELFIGGSLETIIFGRRYNYYGGDFSSIQGSGSGEVSSALAPSADLFYALSQDQRLRASLSIPIFAYIARPGYGLLNGNTSVSGYSYDGRFQFIGSFWSWHIAIEYERDLSKYFMAGLRFSTLYYRYPRFDWVSSTAENEAKAYISWRFHF
ncbi:MAG TPA: hypothetical protein VG537_08985 [Candidatus Kapabacteria bacterium]|nr:hypothetical protein [Candidatus Kapabacteria bacterium]